MKLRTRAKVWAKFVVEVLLACWSWLVTPSHGVEPMSPEVYAIRARQKILNLGLYMAGWGGFVVVVQPFEQSRAFDSFPDPTGGLAFGLVYGALGLLCWALVRFESRKRTFKVAVSIMTGVMASITSFFFFSCLQLAIENDDWISVWSTGIYTYVIFTILSASAGLDFIRGGYDGAAQISQ